MSSFARFTVGPLIDSPLSFPVLVRSSARLPAPACLYTCTYVPSFAGSLVRSCVRECVILLVCVFICSFYHSLVL